MPVESGFSRRPLPRLRSFPKKGSLGGEDAADPGTSPCECSGISIKTGRSPGWMPRGPERFR